VDRARRALAPGVLAVVALALASGCTATNEQTTTLGYVPSDGQDVTLGQVRAASLMVVSAGGNAPGALVGRLINSSDAASTVTMTGEGGASLHESFQVPPRSTLAIGPDEKTSVTLDPVGAQPGGLINVSLSSTGGHARRTTVPVLTDTLPEYATLVPTPSASAPTAGPTPTGSSTRGTGTPSQPPVVTASPTDSPSGGASLSPSGRVRTLSPSGSPTG
jgi:hypothetical protein